MTESLPGRSGGKGQAGGGGGRRVTIACQGGGSHTAFTAGVLSRLLGAVELEDHRVVALSGTSGGAVCALLAWSALRDGEPGRARELLEGFWADNSASDPVAMTLNTWLVWASTLQSTGMLPAVSPYDIPVTGVDHFRDLLCRWVDFERIEVDALAGSPLLLIGAVDVLSGRFRAFHSRRDRISADIVLASAAIPTVFPAIHTDGETFWDGLFSQNPPVRELLEAQPDELWVIQINPTTMEREPRSGIDIADRRNKLSGNLSLYQELHVIEKIDQLLAEGVLRTNRSAKRTCSPTCRHVAHSRTAFLEIASPLATQLVHNTPDPAALDDAFADLHAAAQVPGRTFGSGAAWTGSVLVDVPATARPD